MQQLATLLASLCPVLADTLESLAADNVRATCTPQLEGLFADVSANASKFRAAIYRTVSLQLIHVEPAISAIRSRSWAPKEGGSHHNTYVDALLQLIQKLNGYLCIAVPALSELAKCSLLDEATLHIAGQLVDAYAQIKKCNDEGRALMARDIKVLQAALENLQRRGVLPNQKLSLAYAATYVAALHLPAEQVLGWAHEHREYSMKHLSALVLTVGACSSQLDKRKQQQLIAALQELHSQPICVAK